MVMFWKAAAIVIVTVILSAAVGKKEKDIAVVLIAVACCGIAGLAMQSLSDVISFLWKLCDFTEYQNSFAGTMMKIAGVAVVTEMTSLVSVDAGCSTLEKAMQFLGTVTILSLSLPLFESFINIVQEILNFA